MPVDLKDLGFAVAILRNVDCDVAATAVCAAITELTELRSRPAVPPWSKEKPAVPGWYWQRFGIGGKGAPRIVRVIDGERYRSPKGHAWPLPNPCDQCDWCGPLPNPPGPEGEPPCVP